jgi:hypothetical protein
MLRLRLFDILERFSANVAGPFYRRLGQSLTESGVRIQGDPNADDRRKIQSQEETLDLIEIHFSLSLLYLSSPSLNNFA